MKQYQIWDFVFLTYRKGKGRGTSIYNAINGTDEEDEEFYIPCFNGISFFKSRDGRYYKMLYPKIQSLKCDDEKICEIHGGYVPGPCEYGPIASALGRTVKITKKEFEELRQEYPIKHKDKAYLEWERTPKFSFNK